MQKQRITVRVAGESVGVGDTVVVALSTPELVVNVGIVGDVCRMRLYDELSGDNVAEPELWFIDRRTGHRVGPIERRHILSIYPIDGHWMTDEECRAEGGDESYTSSTDCGPAQ